MSSLDSRDGALYLEDCSLGDIAKTHGTPSFVYSRSAIETAYLAYADALAGCDHLICYAVKANSNLAVLNVLARLGAGFDVVSVGELQRVLQAGGDPRKVVFSGVGKTKADMNAALDAGIHCFNIESEAEIHALQSVAAERNQKAPVSIRVNPDVDAQTHPYISTGLSENKFGIAFDVARAAYGLAAKQSHLDVQGIDCHIGSQLTEVAPFLDALDRLLELVDQLAEDGITLGHIDIGGGLGVRYQDEQPPSAGDYLSKVRERLADRALQIVVEPGRSIVANAGWMLTEVIYLKQNGDRHFAVVDAAMNDMIRPALYQAWIGVERLQAAPSDLPMRRYDVVGPVCETADFLAKERELQLQAGDHLAFHSCGAYGFAMSSNYNTRPRAAELMVDGADCFVVRERESYAQLVEGERLLPGNRP